VKNDRGTEFTGKPLSPAVPYLFSRTPDATLLCIADAKIFHAHVATALYLANRTRPLIGPAIGELCGCVKAPTVEDDRKFDRVILFLKTTRDDPLRLGCTMLPRVTISIGAVLANRQTMRSTTGMCHARNRIFYYVLQDAETEFQVIHGGRIHRRIGRHEHSVASYGIKDTRNSQCAWNKTTNHVSHCSTRDVQLVY
jgi:hypothetical protein